MSIGRPFKKGQSGNPGGRPKVVAEVNELARAHIAEAIETLASIMTNPKSAPAARVSAANALLDRDYGNPPPAHYRSECQLRRTFCPNDAKQPRSGTATVETRRALTKPSDEVDCARQ